MPLCMCIFRNDERPRKKLHGEGTNTQTDIATTRKNWPEGRFFEKMYHINFTRIYLDMFERVM